MKILSGAQMARWDRLSIRRHGISALGLMRRAAEACAGELRAQALWQRGARVVVVCGPGNNGGDGFAIAGLLARAGARLEVFFLGEAEKLSAEARHFHDRCPVSVLPLRGGRDFSALKKALRSADFLVDAIFGIGLKRPLTGRHAAAVQAMNRASAFKLAVDMPSGIDADTGAALGEAFRADLTVTFEVPKWGQILPPAWDYVGRLEVRPIGLSPAVLARLSSSAEWVDAGWVRRRWRRRSRGTHKGAAGRVLVVAGSCEMPGAGYLSATSALRIGAGLVVWALPEEAYRKIDLRYPEVILFPVASEQGRFAKSSWPAVVAKAKASSAVAMGPGLGQSESLREFLRQVLRHLKQPKVLDADALNNLAALKGRGALLRGAVLTPHLLEMSRLCGRPVSEIQARPVESARRFARRHRCWLVLKGYRSVIAGPKGQVWINSSGGPNLATAGSGDVLTGTIAGLLAQGLKSEIAVPTAVFLHGRAGDLLAERQGDRGTLASEIARRLSEAVP